MPTPPKIPVSTLIVVHTRAPSVLLIERADFARHWQSVTGSQESGETLVQTATREVLEETGIDATQYGGVVDWHLCNVYEIFRQWRHRYPPGITHNMEHVFGLELPAELPVALAAAEHTAYAWLSPQEAAARCFSWSNREAIERLMRSRIQTGANARFGPALNLGVRYVDQRWRDGEENRLIAATASLRLPGRFSRFAYSTPPGAPPRGGAGGG